MNKILSLLVALVLSTSCEKMAVNNQEQTGKLSTEKNVILQLYPYMTSSLTRANVDITSICTRINVGVFDSAGDKVVSAAQQRSSDNFGTVAFTLTEGVYTVVAIAHNKEKSVPVSSLDKIEFSGGPSDVFLYYGTIDVTEETEVHDLVMTRKVGMFRLTLTDETIPEEVAQIKFTVTGGSQNINPVTGYGCTKSTQTITANVDNEHRSFDIYTFPRQDSNVLNVVVVALAEDGTEIAKKTLTDVPIKVNEVTSYKGKLFDGVTNVSASALEFKADPDWNVINEYDF